MTAINSNRAIRGPVTAVPVVAGKGVRLVADTENNRWVVEADETVLWEGTATGLTTVTLSETLSNFNRAKLIFTPYYSTTTMPKEIKEFIPEASKKIICLTTFVTPNNLNVFKTIFSYENTTLSIESQYYFDGTWSATTNNSQLRLYKVIGINRISASA